MTNVQGMCTLVHAKVMRLIDGTFMRVPQEPGKPGISPTARSKTKKERRKKKSDLLVWSHSRSISSLPLVVTTKKDLTNNPNYRI